VTLEAVDDNPEEVIVVPLPSARQAPQQGVGPWVLGVNTGHNSRVRFYGLRSQQVLSIGGGGGGAAAAAAGGGGGGSGFLGGHLPEPSWRSTLEEHEERHRQHMRQRELRRQQLIQYQDAHSRDRPPFGSSSSTASSSSRPEIYRGRQPASSSSFASAIADATGGNPGSSSSSSTGFGIIRVPNVDLRERVLAHLRETLGAEENDAMAMLDAMDEQTMMALITGGGAFPSARGGGI